MQMQWTAGFIGALALAAATAAPAADSWSGNRMIGIKIAVKDYQQAIEFYSRLGMKEGPKHNAAEQELNWGKDVPGPIIILVHDETGRIKLAAGGSSLMMEVADVAATARTLKESGYPDVGTPRDTKMYAVLMLKDPDGNQIEVLGPPSKAADAPK
jgi:catechol 2,3-dioxygenase-like lactoylglutathione lyase family enzyme